MKKLMLFAVILLTVGLVSCQSKGNKTSEVKTEVKKEMTDNGVVTNALFEGTLPAADGPGIVYKLNIKDLKNGVGTYNLNMNYLDAEKGKDKSFDSKGELRVVKGTTKSGGDVVYQLTPDDNSKRVYFLVKDERTLRLLNENMEAPMDTQLNYDIILVK